MDVVQSLWRQASAISHHAGPLARSLDGVAQMGVTHTRTALDSTGDGGWSGETRCVQDAHEQMKAYVFLICRPNDKGRAWPTVFTDKFLAEHAFGRVSELVEVTLERLTGQPSGYNPAPQTDLPVDRG